MTGLILQRGFTSGHQVWLTMAVALGLATGYADVCGQGMSARDATASGGAPHRARPASA